MSVLTFFSNRRRLLSGLVLIFLIPISAWFAAATFRVARFDPEAQSEAASLFDTEGRLIATLGTRRQAFVPLEEIPKAMRSAIVAIEDARFYHHLGIDLKGIARAVWVNIRSGRKAQGASTITQQLARTLFLSPEKTLTRKLEEAALALILEMRYSKSRILEIYLNRIYFGEGAYGIEEAALTYFGKPTAELTLPESSLLAGLPKAPSSLTPYRNPEGALQRRTVVLNRMVELGYITSGQAQEADSTPLHLAGRRGGQAPYFVDYVSTQLVDRLGATAVYRGALRVYTTLDLNMQAVARDALGKTQGAIVAMDPTTGAIRAMVGGRDYVESQFNRATHALRQPGSAFKPFVYAAALERGLSMNTILVDHPGDFSGYRPENFKGEYWGSVTLKHALTRSLNTASVRLLKRIGVDAGIDMAQRLGVDTLILPDDRNLALALGGLTKGVTPLAMAAAYGTFANRGVRCDPYAIDQVFDSNGRMLFKHRPRHRRVISEEIAYLMTNMLQSVVERGTGTAANIGRPQAGKTGTTNDTLSAWFVGYTPQLVAAVYVGHDTRQPSGGGGGSLAAPIWGKFASAALRDTPVTGFVVPEGIQTNVPIDVFSGLIAGPQCRLQERDAFRVGTAPTQAAPCYWNAAAQPQPYRIGPGVEQLGDDSRFASIPGGPFGDDPIEPSFLPLPATLTYPLGLPQLPGVPLVEEASTPKLSELPETQKVPVPVGVTEPTLPNPSSPPVQPIMPTKARGSSGMPKNAPSRTEEINTDTVSDMEPRRDAPATPEAESEPGEEPPPVQQHEEPEAPDPAE